MSNNLNAFIERLTTPRNTIGLGLFRVLAGSLILLQYLLNYAQRAYLYGPDAVVSWSTFLNQKYGFSLYQLSNQNWYFELLYHVGIVVALLWVMGVRTVLTTPLNYLFWYSLRQRNSLLWDGGDNLMQLMFVYAFFADVGRLRFFATATTATVDTLGSKVRAITHNVALLCFVLQLSLVYGVSGLTKVQGESWQNGTALYYALWPGHFRFPGVSEFLYQSDELLVLGSHATVFFQIAFPFMVLLNRRSRHVAVVLAIVFHLGIAAVMGLFTFAGFMIAAELALISDEGYSWVFARLRRFIDVAFSRWRRRPLATAPQVLLERLRQ